MENGIQKLLSLFDQGSRDSLIETENDCELLHHANKVAQLNQEKKNKQEQRLSSMPIIADNNSIVS